MPVDPTAVEPEPGTDVLAAISEGRTALGIELGSTRIKASLVSADGTALASGSHDWENQ
ncbi:MAG TPA: ATPase, partial [Cellulomonas sp.]